MSRIDHYLPTERSTQAAAATAPEWLSIPLFWQENMSADANALFVKVSFDCVCQFLKRYCSLLSFPLVSSSPCHPKGLLPLLEHRENQCLIKSPKCDCVLLLSSFLSFFLWEMMAGEAEWRVAAWPVHTVLFIFISLHRARTPLRMQWMQTWLTLVRVVLNNTVNTMIHNYM